MIRIYQAGYYKKDKKKTPGHYLVFEIVSQTSDAIQVIVCQPKDFFLAEVIESITEITGYHHYLPKDPLLTPFGFGNLDRIKVDMGKGMLEQVADQAGLAFDQLAIHFGKGLVALNEK